SFHTVVQMIGRNREKKTKTLKLQLKTLKLRLKSLKLRLKLRLKINVESISEEEKMFKHQLKREHILYDYNSFQYIEFIDGGLFGTISRAFSKHHQELVALKSINIDQKYTFEQFLNEAKQHRKVEFHSNILSFYGITKEKKHKKNYMFVLEYADNGNLCDYLKTNFNIMDWNAKLKFAKQIASAAKQHRKVEFHSNILSFYGITKENKSIKFTDLVLIMTSDEREAIIKGTPRKYAEIYTACWQKNPDLRPCIDQVVQDLDNVDITNTVEDIVNLTNQTNNELQNDDLLYSTELSISIISMN
ncbi:16910_t:CDS:2, partial [Entrophospora sp. SA101]